MRTASPSTLGNYLGAWTTYGLARCLLPVKAASPERPRRRALMLFERYGSVALLLSWAPFVGDAIVALAAAAAVRFWVFAAGTIARKA